MSKSPTPGIPRPERLRFPRAARIRLGREFALVRARGRTVQGRFLRLSVVMDRAVEATRFGLVTSKRVGGAVIRNRVRRRLREICRLHRALLAPGWLVVVVAKPAAAGATFSELRDEWLILARRLPILSGS
ncbi:MAG: ribonuclease P protein component [Terrimicrobiaceae bacterium]